MIKRAAENDEAEESTFGADLSSSFIPIDSSSDGFQYPGDILRKSHRPLLPVPMQVMEQYIREHSVHALRNDPHPERRHYAMAFYQCPLQAGNRMHHFWNNLLWAMLTNRTVLYRYWDTEACLAYSNYHKGLCKAANTADDCAKVLDRAPWMASYEEWNSRISASNNDNNTTDHEPFVVPDHVTMAGDGSVPLPPNYREDWGLDLVSKYPHKILVLPICYDKFSDLANDSMQRQLLKTQWARARVKDLFSLGDDFLYGMLHQYTFQFTESIRASTRALLQQHDDKNYYSIGLHSRHRYPELDGCDIDRERKCLKQVISEREDKTRPVQVRLMSDRPCTIERLTDWLQARQFSPLATHIADMRLAHSNCGTLDTISVAELAHELRFSDKGPGDFHILEGYDTVLAVLATGLDIRLNTPVAAVRWAADGAAVETAAGESWHARHVVVTLPLAVLQAGVVAFEPPLPAPQQAALAALAMPPAMKLILRFDEIFWDADMTFLTGRDPLPVWWTVRPGVPILTGFSTGTRAARVAAGGADSVLEQGLAALGAIFGDAPRRHLQDHMLVNWAADEWARGGYSMVPVGAHGMRAQLAQAAGALHFAGEATVFANNPATVHGALHSGERAAGEILGA